jgi:DNA-binding GntR family transcriptional regulator
VRSRGRAPGYAPRTVSREEMTAQAAAELREVHHALESIAARTWAELADEDALDRLWEAYWHVRDRVEAHAPPEDVCYAKALFFRTLLTGAGLVLIREALLRISTRAAIVRHASLAQPGRPEEMLEELFAILAAATARDADALTAACLAHIDREFASGIRALSAR